MLHLPHRPSLRTFVLTCGLLLLVGCGGDATADADPHAPAVAASPAPAASADAVPISAARDAGPPPDDPGAVAANELGGVPVLMYHQIRADGGGEYDRTADEFHAELQRLHDEGYVPIRTDELVDGTFDVPAGKTPVVLTFDDSTKEQMAYTADGQIAPDTAMGILLAFAEENPEFRATGTLYVNEHPFGGVADGPDMLRDLHERGFEIGNHTATHQNLAQVSADEVRRDLAGGVRVIQDIIGDVEVRTLALPLGVWPEPRDLAYSGEADGFAYDHEGIVLVGAGPAPSPFAQEFDPLAIPRIRTAPSPEGEPDYGSGFWLDWFVDNPDQRFISDGDPHWVSYPEDTEVEVEVHAEVGERANPY